VSASVETIELSRCRSCQARFLPSDGPCPRCGSSESQLYLSPALGRVLAATELVHPADGWEAPHRLALVELPEAVRLLAIVDGSLPSVGAVVAVRRDGEIYRARSEPGVAAPPERGEGDVPGSGTSRRPFEPPR
jgi:uncharacterized OB-fold protein